MRLDEERVFQQKCRKKIRGYFLVVTAKSSRFIPISLLEEQKIRIVSSVIEGDFL